MTIDRMAMKELLEKGSDQDLLREMMAFVAIAHDGRRGREPDRRRPRRALRRSNEPAQRLSRTRLAHRRRHRAGGDPEASQGLVFPVVSGSLAAPPTRR